MIRLAAPLLAVIALTCAAASAVKAVAPTVAGYGISVAPPAGWHVRITRGLLEAATTTLPRPDATPSVSLGGALDRDDIGILLFEDAPAAGVPFDAHAYERAARRPFTRRDFGQPATSVSSPGRHRFAHRGIRLSGRHFALFIETGVGQPTTAGLAGLNQLTHSLRVTRGDFYPGTAAPARFPDEPGWHLLSSPRVPIGPETQTTSIAATVAYRDPINAFPPHSTLARLPASGVILYVQLVADNRNPPLALAHSAAGSPSLRLPTAGCGSFEGIPAPQRATCALHIVVARHYVIQGWVIYGRAQPSREQQAQAEAEFARLELPAWPLWPAG